MKIVLLLVSLVMFTYSAPSIAGATPDTEKAVVAVAKKWLSLIDNGRYSDSWKGASVYFQGAISERNWEASLLGVRKPMGKLVFRRITTTRLAKELPGAPNGQYLVMEFRTSFEFKKSATETVTFMLEKNGTWKAAGYFIK